MEIKTTEVIKECITCQSKECRNSRSGELHTCRYGISYFNDGNGILKNRERVTKLDLAANLKHELNRTLQYIINQAEEIDPNVSTRKVDLGSPASRIVGATVILDHFIEMLCGAHYYHGIQAAKPAQENVVLRDLVDKYIGMYSLIKNSRRVRALDLRTDVARDIRVSTQSSKIAYIVAILCDNLWKYAHPSYPVYIFTKARTKTTIDLHFSNYGKPIPNDCNPFEIGYQLNKDSEGFGYGLSWAEVLAHQYNYESGAAGSDGLAVSHKMEFCENEDLVRHVFKVSNIIVADR